MDFHTTQFILMLLLTHFNFSLNSFFFFSFSFFFSFFFFFKKLNFLIFQFFSKLLKKKYTLFSLSFLTNSKKKIKVNKISIYIEKLIKLSNQKKSLDLSSSNFFGISFFLSIFFS